MTIDKASVERVAEIISKDNVRFINLQFTDLMGLVKRNHHFRGTLELRRQSSHGMWFDGSSIEGFARIAEGDMYLVPDLDTFTVITWDREDMLSASCYLRCVYAAWQAVCRRSAYHSQTGVG